MADQFVTPFHQFIQANVEANPNADTFALTEHYRQQYGVGPTEDDYNNWVERYRASAPDDPLTDDELRGTYEYKYGEVAPAPGDVSRALSDAWSETKGLGGGLVGYVGDALGLDSVRDWGYNTFQENMQDVQRNQRQQYDADYLLNEGGFGDWVDAAQYYGAKVIPSLAGGLGAGLVGKQIAKGVVKNAAESAIEKAAKVGFGAGLTAYGTGQTIGEIYPEAVDEAARTGSDPDLLRVGLAGLASGAVEGLSDWILLGAGRLAPSLGRITDFASKGPAPVRAGSIAAGSILTEAGEEGLQVPLEYLGANKEIGTDEYYKELRQSMLAGGLGGAGISTVTVPTNLLIGDPEARRRAQEDAAAELRDQAVRESLGLKIGAYNQLQSDIKQGVAQANTLARAPAGLGSYDLLQNGGLTSEGIDATLDQYAKPADKKEREQIEKELTAAYDEPSGTIVRDPVTQVERELSVGEELYYRATGEVPKETKKADTAEKQSAPKPKTKAQIKREEQQAAAESLLSTLSPEARTAVTESPKPDAVTRNLLKFEETLARLSTKTPELAAEARASLDKWEKQYGSENSRHMFGAGTAAKLDMVLARRAELFPPVAPVADVPAPTAPVAPPVADVPAPAAPVAPPVANVRAPALTYDSPTQALVAIGGATGVLTDAEAAAIQLDFGFDVDGIDVEVSETGQMTTRALAQKMHKAGLIKNDHPQTAVRLIQSGMKKLMEHAARLERDNPQLIAAVREQFAAAEAARAENDANLNVLEEDTGAVDFVKPEDSGIAIRSRGAGGVNQLGIDGAENLSAASAEKFELYEQQRRVHEEAQAAALAESNAQRMQQLEAKARSVWGKVMPDVPFENLSEQNREQWLDFVAQAEELPVSKQVKAFISAGKQLRQEMLSGPDQATKYVEDTSGVGGDAAGSSSSVPERPEVSSDAGTSGRAQAPDASGGAAPRIAVKKRRHVDPDARLGENPGATNPTTREAFDAALTTLLGKNHHWRIKVYDTPEEAYADGVPAEHLRGNSGYGAYGIVAKKHGVPHATFILSRIAKGRELSAVFHEVGSHIGIEGVLTKPQLSRLSKKVQRWADGSGDSIEVQAARRAIQRVEAAKTPSAAVGQELVAYFVEEAVALGVNPTEISSKTQLGQWFGSLLKAVKRALSKWGLGRHDLTAQDLVDFARGAARTVLDADAVQDSNTMFGEARSDATIQAYEKRIDELFAPNSKAARAGVKVLDHSNLLEMLGFGSGGLYAAESKIIDSRFNHHLTAEHWKKIPKWLEDPVAVFDSETVNGRLVIVAPETVNGDPVVMVVTPDIQAGANNVSLLVNAYDAVGGKPFERWSDAGLMRYFDEKQSRVLRGTSGLRLPRVATHLKHGSGNKIYRKADLRKVQNDEPLFGEAAAPAITDALRASANALNGTQQYRETVSNVVDVIKNAAKQAHMGLAFTHDVADYVTEKFPAMAPHAKRLLDLIGRRSVTQSKMMERASDTTRAFADLSANDQKQVNRFLLDSTMSQKWGYDPVKYGWTPTSKAVIDDKMRSAFNALTPAAQEVVVGVNKWNAESLKQKQQALDDLAAATGAKPIKLSELQGPYATIMRDGKYVVVGMSQEFAALSEQLKTADTQDADAIRKKLNTMRRDERHYFLDFATNRYEANSMRNKVAKRYAVAERFEKAQYRDRSPVGFTELSRLRAAVENSAVKSDKDKAFQKSVLKMLDEIELGIVSQQHARQTEHTRKNVFGAGMGEDAGQPRDMMRAFRSNAQSQSHYVANLQYLNEINSALGEMTRIAEKAPLDAKDDVRRVTNELWSRVQANMEYTPSPVQDFVTSLNAGWHLVLSPAFYIQNAFQPVLMTQPWLAKTHGYKASWSALFDAYRSLLPMLRTAKVSANQVIPFDPTAAARNDGERAMLEDLLEKGYLDFGLGSDLGGHATGKFGQWYDNTLRRLPTMLETINRTTSALAAYRLAESEGHDVASEYASKTVRVTQGLYDQLSAPRWISPAFHKNLPAKVVFQYRKFQILQAGIFGRLAYQAMRGSDEKTQIDDNTKEAARAALGYTFANYAAVAGAMGLPGVAAIQTIVQMLGAAFGDDDEPWDKDAQLVKVRRGLESLGIGSEFADMLLKGVPMGAGVDLSSKTGAANMLSWIPYTDFSMDRSFYEKAIVAGLGPTIGGLGPKWWQGMGLLSQGETLKAFEKFLPTGMNNMAKLYRLESKGETTYNGDRVLSPEEVSFTDDLLVALGLQPDKLQKRYDVQGASQSYEDKFSSRTTEIKRAYAEAVESGDKAEMQKQRNAWHKLQTTKRREGFKPSPMSELTRSVQAKRKRERDTLGGVKFDRGNRQFVENNADLFGL